MPAERTSRTYGPGVTAASRAVLLELMTLLRPYRDALVLVGGWVPSFLLEQRRRPDDRFVHVGSIDIDLAIDPARVEEPAYATIAELLRHRGYRPVPDRRAERLPGGFERDVRSPVNRKPYVIRVDFLTPAVNGADAGGRALVVQEALLARKIRGCEAAFRHQTTIQMSGTLPDGGALTVPLRMADVVASLAMKGIVLGERYREKDAYDIYALVAHYGQGPREVADALRGHLDDPLVAEGLRGIRAAFASRQAHGPAWVAAFLVNPVLAAERERMITEAHLVVQELLSLLGEPVALRAP